MRILILCTGNSCRSQMAQGFLQSFDNLLEVYSAGTHQVQQVHPKAIMVMQERQRSVVVNDAGGTLVLIGPFHTHNTPT